MNGRTDIDPARRRLLGAFALSFAGAAFTLAGRAAAQPAVPIEVWTGPSCSCCRGWIAHLEANGFLVSQHEGGNGEARTRLGMPVHYGSCHTAEVAGYAIEGHVPATEIYRLLAERPAAIGLAVPAMPRGSPGMDDPAYGGVRDPYDVLLIGRDGQASIFQSYR